MNAAMEPLRQQVTEKEDLLQAALAAKADWNETEEKFNLQVFLCLILLLGPCRGRGANHLEHVFARAHHSSRYQDKGKKPTGQGEGSKDRQLQHFNLSIQPIFHALETFAEVGSKSLEMSICGVVSFVAMRCVEVRWHGVVCSGVVLGCVAVVGPGQVFQPFQRHSLQFLCFLLKSLLFLRCSYNTSILVAANRLPPRRLRSNSPRWGRWWFAKTANPNTISSYVCSWHPLSFGLPVDQTSK